MDYLQLRSYLAIRSIEKFPESYHIKAKALMENILPEEELLLQQGELSQVQSVTEQQSSEATTDQ